MNSRLLFALCVAIFGLLTTQVAADLCLGMSFSTKTKVCGGVIPCEFGMYCDKTATCTTTKAAGQSCEESHECQFGLSCNGPDNGKVCVAYAGPGQACSSLTNSTQPRCASGLSCDFTTSKCTNGRYGDGCTTGDDCASGVCTGGSCAVPTECSIFAPLGCEPTHFCEGDMTSATCVAKKTAGATCTSDTQCADSGCLGKTPDDENPVCVAKASLDGGVWIGSSNKRHLCKSGISYNGHCSTGSAVYCDDEEDCITGETCLCGKGWKLQGIGKCAKNKCNDLALVMNQCFKDNCGSEDLLNLRYSNSCVSRNCRAAFDEVVNCNPTLVNMIVS